MAKTGSKQKKAIKMPLITGNALAESFCCQKLALHGYFVL